MTVGPHRALRNRRWLALGLGLGLGLVLWLEVCAGFSGVLSVLAEDRVSGGAQAADPNAGLPWQDHEPQTLAQLQPGVENEEAQRVRRELDEILAQPAFRRVRREVEEKAAPTPYEEPGWLKRFLKWLWDWLTKGGKALSQLGVLWQILAYTLIAIVASLIIWLVVRAVNSYRQAAAERVTRTLRPEEGETALPPGDVSADEYERRAAELAAQGRFREAIGQLILGAMSRIERGRLIRFRRGLTHRDYLRALRSRARPQQSFRNLVSVYEPVCFGRRPAHEAHFQSAQEAYLSGFADPTLLNAPTPAGALA
ncbi:MAG: DUF4129 domain-containing protein [Planctomycetales bacterium]